LSELARLEFRRVSGIPVATVRGEIDLSNAEEVLEAGLEGAVTDGAPSVVLDLSGVVYMDSAGIRALFELHERLAALGKRMVAVVPEEAPIRRVLELADAPSVLSLSPSVEAAVAALDAD
jgi:stage II sporulation protein AA (anti-sigma F factor antagonist)